MKNHQKPVTANIMKMLDTQVAGHIALDFCNTAGEHAAAEPKEYFSIWSDFVQWALNAGLVAENTRAEMLTEQAPIGGVIAFREMVFDIGFALAKGQKVKPAQLQALRDYASMPRPAVVATGHRFYWRPQGKSAWPELRAVLASEALSLFCSDDANRIGVCEGGECGWLFVDDSRGKKRRWCAMNDCGAKAKARRYYLKQRDAQ